MNRRDLLRLVSALALTAPMPVLSQPKAVTKGKVSARLSAQSAVNKAGRQRMLSQRMAKCYAQIGLNVLAVPALTIMNNSTALFELQLRELLDYAPTDASRQLFNQQSKIFDEYRDLLRSTPSKENGTQVLALSEGLLKNAQAATVELDKISGMPAAAIVNLAGRQRMLSQRTAKFYFFADWGVSNNASLEIKQNSDEFRAAITTLKSSPIVMPDIRANIALGESQWHFFESALVAQAQGKGDEISRRNVATTSERILEVFEIVTQLLEQVA